MKKILPDQIAFLTLNDRHRIPLRALPLDYNIIGLRFPQFA